MVEMAIKTDPRLGAKSTDGAEHRDGFVMAMGKAATGVTVVATDGDAGRFALTVSSMCSVSADPPTLLICVGRGSPVCAALTSNRVFSVSVLAESQAGISETFAGRPSSGEPYDFACATWRQGLLGVPTLSGAVAIFECELVQEIDAGSHRILVGSVMTSTTAACQRPLIYHARSYGRHRPLDIGCDDLGNPPHITRRPR